MPPIPALWRQGDLDFKGSLSYVGSSRLHETPSQRTKTEMTATTNRPKEVTSSVPINQEKLAEVLHAVQLNTGQILLVCLQLILF